MRDADIPKLARLTWDENNQPLSEQFNDVYFSKQSGLEESRYVFIDNNDLNHRWAQLQNNEIFTIAETGFGSGLNFLATWHEWQKQFGNTKSPRTPQLHFISLEKHPLSKSDLQRALSLWPDLALLANDLIANYPPQPTPGTHRILLAENIKLTIIFGDAAPSLTYLAPAAANGEMAPNNYQFGGRDFYVNAWFLDGFAPAKNPDMWSMELFLAIARLSREASTFATFSAAGIVKRGLESVGFRVQKAPGFGRKRDMLKGIFASTTPNNSEPLDEMRAKKRGDPARLYWHLQTSSAEAQPPKQIAIIGGGLAGCQAAFALARRNIGVTLFEKSTELAQSASGNRQGALYTKLSPHNNPLSELNLTAQIFASHFYRQNLLPSGDSLFELCGDACGVLHLAAKANQKAHYQSLALCYRDSDFCRWLEPREASIIAGLNVRHPALYLPNSGWLAPEKLCKTLCSVPGIELRLNTAVVSLAQSAKKWQLLDIHGETLCCVDAVVIANAHSARQFPQTQRLPLKTIRGQVTHIASTQRLGVTLQGLKSVICGEGYIAPSYQQQYCCGATFTLKNNNPDLDPSCHQANLANLQEMLQCPDFGDADIHTLDGRVGFRTTTPDYFPIVGPVADEPVMLQRFERLRTKANADIANAGAFIHGLYTLLGLGSRGLAYSPLAAELLASLICGEALPISQHLYRHLHPARFIIRELMRNGPLR